MASVNQKSHISILIENEVDDNVQNHTKDNHFIIEVHKSSKERYEEDEETDKESDYESSEDDTDTSHSDEEDPRIAAAKEKIKRYRQHLVDIANEKWDIIPVPTVREASKVAFQIKYHSTSTEDVKDLPLNTQFSKEEETERTCSNLIADNIVYIFYAISVYIIYMVASTYKVFDISIMSRFVAWFLEFAAACIRNTTSTFYWISANFYMLLVNLGFCFVERCLPACVRDDIIGSDDGFRPFSGRDISAAANAAAAESRQNPTGNRPVTFQRIERQPKKSSKTVGRCNVPPAALRRANETWRSMELPEDSQRRCTISFNESDEVREFTIDDDQHSTTSDLQARDAAREESPSLSRYSRFQLSPLESSSMSHTNSDVAMSQGSSLLPEPSTPESSRTESTEISTTPREFAVTSPEFQYLSQRHRLSDCSVSVHSTPRQTRDFPRSETPPSENSTPRRSRGRDVQSSEINVMSPLRVLLENSTLQSPRRLIFEDDTADQPAAHSISIPGSRQVSPQQLAVRRPEFRLPPLEQTPSKKPSPRK